jgi:hypothetical protein
MKKAISLLFLVPGLVLLQIAQMIDDDLVLEVMMGLLKKMANEAGMELKHK